MRKSNKQYNPRRSNQNKLNTVKERKYTSIEEKEDNIIDWCTFYRRNIHRFVEHYFGLHLYFYQKIMLYLMNLCPLVVLLCSRAVGKSFITSIYCCAVAVLYPGSKILATAKRKHTVELLIKEKIEKELITKSPNLAREIKKINTSNNKMEVIFHNGSSFVVSPCNDDARGQRLTLLVVDEFRQCDKTILDSVFSPMAIKRQPPFSSKPEYEHLKEEPREIYLSSAFYKSHWMWGLIKEAIIGAYENKSICVSMDYAVSVKHNIRSTAYMEKEKKKMSPIVFDMEYNNLMAGGAENQYYSFELTSQAQKIKKAWYPMPLEDYINKKKTWFGDIKKQDGEIRIVSMDIAMMSTVKGKSANDLSVIKCIRALPNGNKYERQEVYTRTMEGVDIEQQAIKVRRIMYDFKADYIVFDGRTYGINFTDAMAKTLYDEERDIEYPPIKVMNNKDLADRCKNDLAMPIMWAFMGTSENNHKMHTAMLSALMDKKYKMLISQVNCKEEYLLDKKEYQLGNLDQKALYELPYVLSDLTVNEMINLSKDFVQGSYIKLIEPRNGLKDKYVTSAMANLFIQDELEIKLTEKAKDTRGYYSVLRKFRQPKVYK